MSTSSGRLMANTTARANEDAEVYTVFAGHESGVYSYLAGYRFMGSDPVRLIVITIDN